MKVLFSSFGRVFGICLLAMGFSSCSLFRDGKYASQWEIESDVPASLSSGTAAVPDTMVTAMPRVKSNLSRNPGSPSTADGVDLDLPIVEKNEMVEVPKPDFAESARVYEQSPPEMLNVPSAAGQRTEASESGNGGLSDLTTLLPEPPIEVTEEELASAPAALPPVILGGPVNPEPSGPGPVSEPPGLEAGKAPVASTTIPLLYGQLDFASLLSPTTTPAPATVEPEPAPAPMQNALGQ
jgi:hypothetical protein